MKKRYFFMLMLFFLFIFNINIITANAYYESKDELEWIDSGCVPGKCLKLCSYYTETDPIEDDQKNYFQGIYVYYHLDGTYQVSYDKQKIFSSTNENYGKTITKKGTKEEIFQTFGVKMSPEAYNNLVNNGTCPKYAYVYSVIGSDSVCFDNGQYCSLSKGYDIYGRESYSTMNFDSTLKTYFDSFPTDQCPSYKECNIYQIYESFVVDFYLNYLKENKIPLFIQNNITYKSGIEKILGLYDSHRKKVKEEIDGDSSLSKAEKDSIYKKLDEDITTRKEGLQNFLIDFSEKPKNESGDNSDLGTVVTGCEVIPEVIRKWINNILNFVKYIALVLVIALGALDFMKAAGSGEPNGMKKAGQSFVKRLIAVVILFLLPEIVDFILNMINIYGVDPNNVDCL